MARKFNALTTIIYQSDISQEQLYKVSENFPCAISPLHNKDVNTSTGELKAPHWHIVFSCNLTKTQKAAFLKACNTRDNMPFQYVRSGTCIMNYLTHDTNESRKKGKYVYNKDDIFYSDLFDDDALLCEDIDYRRKAYDTIINGGLTEFSVFIGIVMADSDVDYVDYVFKNETKFYHLLENLHFCKKRVLSNTQGYVNLEVSIDDN